MKRQITIEIDSNQKTCGKCVYRVASICGIYRVRMETTKDNLCKRLDECMASETKQIEDNKNEKR